MPGPCTFSISTCAADGPWVRLLLPHILRGCRHRFAHRMLVLDDLPKRGRPTPPEGPLRELEDWALGEGHVDEVLRLASLRDAPWMARHFVPRPRLWLRDFRGIPLTLWAAPLHHRDEPYHVHFDGDMLLAPAATGSWVDEAIALAEAEPRAGILAPHPGPATAPETLRQTDPYHRDDAGRLWFTTFSSRRFLIARRTLERLLPLRMGAVPSRRTLARRLLTGRSIRPTWEMLANDALRRAGLSRVHLPPAWGWTLHLAERPPELLAALPEVIARIERGDSPNAQHGVYDLLPAAWLAPAP